MMEGLCEARLKKQGRLSIEKLVLICSRTVISRRERYTVDNIRITKTITTGVISLTVMFHCISLLLRVYYRILSDNLHFVLIM